MNCDEASVLLAAAADGEIDGLRGYAVRKHLAGCPGCTTKHQALLALRQRLGAELPYFEAPSPLRSRVRAQHPSATVSTVPARAQALTSGRRWRWFGAGVLAGMSAVAMVWGLRATLLGGHGPQDLATQVVALHTRATLSHRLVDVSSSDRHRVRPWLSARLDYAIPVQDWVQAGFPLLGARVDQLDRRPIATLVYRHREHIIDVFVRPETMPGAAPVGLTARGFNVASAHDGEMEWLATSDLGMVALRAFVDGLARGAVTPTTE